jgi:hypothetical protein
VTPQLDLSSVEEMGARCAPSFYCELIEDANSGFFYDA